METGATKLKRATAMILATACMATAVLSISCGGGGTMATTPISAAGFSVSPTTITFANQTVGTTSSAQTATLTNVGNAVLTISSIQVAGPNASDFSSTNTCSSSLAPSAQCTFSVTLTPSTTGARTASVVFTDNANGSPQSVNLAGTGADAVVSLSPNSLRFDDQTPASTAQSVSVNNTGTGALSIAHIALTADNPSYFSESTTCGASVPAGGSCTISVAFTATSAGDHTGSVTIADNAAASPQLISLLGKRTSSSPAAGLSPGSLTFGSEPVTAASAPLTVTLSNTGSAALGVTSIALAGTNASDFAQTNNCGSSVAAGANCTISVTFKPAATGTRTATVTVTDGAAGSPQSVSLTGTGTAAAASLSPTSLTFGNEPVDMISSSQVVTLNNTGSAALSITSIAFTGADATDFTQVDACGASVAAGGNCTIAILFTPAAIGTRVASLGITDNASGSPQTVPLSGAGTHDVILSWTDSTTSGAVGYNVYRGTTSGGESATPLNSSPINGTTYTDAIVQPGQTYYYVSRAVASNDVTQSANSNEVSATVPSP